MRRYEAIELTDCEIRRILAEHFGTKAEFIHFGIDKYISPQEEYLSLSAKIYINKEVEKK